MQKKSLLSDFDSTPSSPVFQKSLSSCVKGEGRDGLFSSKSISIRINQRDPYHNINKSSKFIPLDGQLKGAGKSRRIRNKLDSSETCKHTSFDDSSSFSTNSFRRKKNTGDNSLKRFFLGKKNWRALEDDGDCYEIPYLAKPFQNEVCEEPEKSPSDEKSSFGNIPNLMPVYDTEPSVSSLDSSSTISSSGSSSFFATAHFEKPSCDADELALLDSAELPLDAPLPDLLPPVPTVTQNEQQDFFLEPQTFGKLSIGTNKKSRKDECNSMSHEINFNGESKFNSRKIANSKSSVFRVDPSSSPASSMQSQRTNYDRSRNLGILPISSPSSHGSPWGQHHQDRDNECGGDVLGSQHAIISKSDSDSDGSVMSWLVNEVHSIRDETICECVSEI